MVKFNIFTITTFISNICWLSSALEILRLKHLGRHYLNDLQEFVQGHMNKYYREDLIWVLKNEYVTLNVTSNHGYTNSLFTMEETFRVLLPLTTCKTNIYSFDLETISESNFKMTP